MKPLLIKLLITLTLSAPLHSTYAGESILVQSTTSTANSGLYDFILPLFEQQTNIKVNVVAVGTGQAIRNARNCDADVLLVHAKSSEEKFVEEGYGVQRLDLMYNDFVIVGPQNDPADINEADNATDALSKIAAGKALFASRGDNSGTHKKEVSLWQATSIDPTTDSGRWYRETGSGMGATLNVSVGMNAYTLTDRATWISFNNKQQHKILLEGDSTLFNQYGVILVNEKKCPDTNSHAGQKFIDWMTSPEGQQRIAQFTLDDQQLFYPNAAPQ